MLPRARRLVPLAASLGLAFGPLSMTYLAGRGVTLDEIDKTIGILRQQATLQSQARKAAEIAKVLGLSAKN